MKRCLIIFAKEPRRGKVKTRLRNYLPENQGFNLYKAFLKDTLNLARSIRCEEKILAYESSSRTPGYLKRIAGDFTFYKQNGRNLGEKMHHAFKFAKENKAGKIVIIGSDSPNLPRSFIEGAFRRLNQDDVVLGPSLDGGYYLIGLKRPCQGLFKDIKWSSSTVLADTLKRAKVLKKNLSLLDRWYDVDDPQALDYLKCDLKKSDKAKWTKKFLKI